MYSYKRCHGDYYIWNHFVTKCSFRHNLTEVTKQENYLTKAVKEYALMLEMPWRPLNMESFHHKMFISSQNVHFVTTLLKPLNKTLS